MFGLFKKRRSDDLSRDNECRTIIQEIFGIDPVDTDLYRLALTHRSASVLHDGNGTNNERLEFLGDAVIETVVSDYLYSNFPQEKEGFLTQMRSRIVSRSMLNELAVKLGLDKHVKLSSNGNLVQKHIYGNALEAVTGAVYLDLGYDTAHSVFTRAVLDRFLDLNDMSITETDFKSRLIEWCQKSKHAIYFNTVSAEGSTAQKPLFHSSVLIDDLKIGYGSGTSKKEAEQHASYAVLDVLSDQAGDDILEYVDRFE